MDTLKLAKSIYSKVGNKAWEPKDPSCDGIKALIEDGFLERCDMFWGYEAFKDRGVRWTAAGLAAASGA